MSIETGGPAFPLQSIGPDFAPGYAGMSLRDYFAANVDVSVYRPLETLSSKINRIPTVNELAEYIADIRSIEADAMLAARKNTEDI